MKTLLLTLLLVHVVPLDSCIPAPSPDDAGALGMVSPDLSAPTDGISAPGTCHIPPLPCGVGGGVVCDVDAACFNGNCVPVCLDAMQCPVTSIGTCPAGYMSTAIGCFLPCYASACSGGCPALPIE